MTAVSNSVFYPRWLENGMELCLETLDHLLSRLPVYELSCRPDEEAVALTEQTIFGGERFWHTMNEIKRILQKIKEGKLKKLIGELLWMYAYVRKYWLLIGVYILLGASGSVLSLGTSVVSRDLVDTVTGVKSAKIVQVAVTYVGSVFPRSLSMRSRPGCPSRCG